MKSLLNFLFFTVCICSSCKKDIGCENEQFTYLGNEIKAYMLHPVGSYWVYQDSLNGRLDTVKIVAKSESLLLDVDNCVNFEFISNEVSSSQHEYSIDATLSFNDGDQKSDYPIYYGRDLVFFSNVAKTHIGSSSSSRYLGFSKILVLNGVEYKNVRKYRNSPSPSNRFQKTLSIAKGIGFIRKEYSNGEVWNLIDYKVD